MVFAHHHQFSRSETFHIGCHSISLLFPSLYQLYMLSNSNWFFRQFDNIMDKPTTSSKTEGKQGADTIYNHAINAILSFPTKTVLVDKAYGWKK